MKWGPCHSKQSDHRPHRTKLSNKYQLDSQKLFSFYRNFDSRRKLWSSLVAQWAKDLSLPWRGFDPWPQNFQMLWTWPKRGRFFKKLELPSKNIMWKGHIWVTYIYTIKCLIIISSQTPSLRPRGFCSSWYFQGIRVHWT